MDASPNIMARIEADLDRVRTERAGLIRRLGPLDEKIERLTATLSVLDEYSTNGSSAHLSVHSPNATGPASLKDATILAISSSEKPMSVPDVADSVMQMNLEYKSDRETLERSLRGIISRAHREGQIERVARGLYGPHSAGPTAAERESPDPEPER